MKKYGIFLLVLLTLPLYSQISSFTDNFEDGKLDTTINGETDSLWTTADPGIFGLSESESTLNIEYTRSSDDRDWPFMRFTPPENIDVSENPKITFKIKSDVEFNLQMKPVYNDGSENFTEMGTVPGDENWSIYELNLQEENYSGATLETIYIHFDGGANPDKQGNVFFDDLKIAEFSINVQDLEAKVLSSSEIELNWSGDKPDKTDYYKIYRDTISGFTPDSETFIEEISKTEYLDSDLSSDTWYYRIAAVDNDGKEHLPSKEVSARTYKTGTVPGVNITGTNTQTVRQYDKYEIKLDLSDASYENPYNPEQIKVNAEFVSPSGDTTKIPGFYDNYKNTDQWKVRFAPDEIGEWEYQVYVEDIDGVGSSEKKTFTAEESSYHGPLKVSDNNPHYFEYHDGKTFYGVGAYYPWGVKNTEDGLDILEKSGGNIFGYWNGTYDNAGNGGGAYIIESARTGIGYYDQQKCARIDTLVKWAEERDMKMMLAIWPHDVLDKTVWDYEQWQNNAFKEIVDAKNFYSDSLSWEYQKKLYRYMIARWGYSRGMGIWEFVNEINGTDGWVHGDQSKAVEWVNKMHTYFKNNDPYHRPTTINMSGSSSNYFSDGYKNVDVPNTHLYESGWNQKYSNDPYRSSYFVYHKVSNRFWNDFEKPAIFGEAGATPEKHMYANVEIGSEGYTKIYHNAMWASWASGLSMSPIWWEMNNRDLMNDDVFDQMKAFSKVVKDIDYANLDLSPAWITADAADAYLMNTDTSGFGWLRAISDKSIANKKIFARGFNTGTFKLDWYNTWTGNKIGTDTASSIENIMPTYVTESIDKKDISLKIHKIEDGSSSSKLNLFVEKRDTTIGWLRDRRDSTMYKVMSYVTDKEGRLNTTYDKKIEFTLEGPGSLEMNTITAQKGGGTTEYIPSDTEGGSITITAEAEGIGSATYSTEVTSDVDKADNRIPEKFVLEDNYPNPFNPSTTIEYKLPKKSKVKVDIFNIKGQLVERLVNTEKSAGNYKLKWKAGNKPSGVYFYRVKTDNNTKVKKCVLMK